MAHTQFEAISYTWGNGIRDQTIICGGCMVKITSNLARVLRRLRSPDRPLKLWADSICINQENCEEKEHQVGLMGKIYRKAERVRLYIGPDDDHQGPGASSLLDEVGHMVQSIWATLDPSLWDQFPHPDADDPIMIDPRWQCLHKLLAESWFDRGWVVQEAALARQARVVWGDYTFEWDSLMRVAVWLSTRGAYISNRWEFSEVLINAHIHVYLEDHLEFGRQFYDEESWGTPSILRTLDAARELELGDPRDRIYAFMGLPQGPGKDIAPQPNYHDSYLDTYREFAKEYLECTKTPEILDYVYHRDDSHTSAPSWVPRWDISSRSLSLKSGATSLMGSRTGDVVVPVLIDDSTLRVRGVLIDTVHYVSDQFVWETCTPDFVRSVWNSVRACSVHDPYTEWGVFESSQLDAFLSVLSGGSSAGLHAEFRQAEASFTLEAQLEYTSASDENCSDDVETPEGDNTNLYYNHIRSATHHHKLILTERGYMGLAPTSVQVGDSCGIVFGCKSPAILRRATQEHYFHYLGGTTLRSACTYETSEGEQMFWNSLGEDDGLDWTMWDVEEQDIYLC
jgi:hypothetical protein